MSNHDYSPPGGHTPGVPRRPLARGMYHYLLLGTIFWLILYLCWNTPGRVAAQSDDRLVINQVAGRSWPEITLNMTLLGPDGNPVPNVELSQFEVLEDGQPQETLALEFGPTREVPLALVMAIDVSGSMTGEKLDQAKIAAISFLSSLRPDDNVALLAFDDRVIPVLPFTQDRAALELGIQGLNTRGNTAIYDTLYRATQMLEGRPPRERRVVILLTDGADTSSKYSARVSADVARKSGALVYTIGLGADAVDGVLTELAEPTGGNYYKAPAPSDLQAIYQAISRQLSAQIFLRYRSTTRVERSYRLVTVTVKYTSKQGQVVILTRRYRPPPTALQPSTPVPVPTLAPLVVPLPAGISQAPPQSSPRPQRVDLQPMMLRFGVALLAGLAVLLLALGFAAAISPSLASQRLLRYTAGQLDASPEQSKKPPGFGARVLVPAGNALGRRLAKLSPKGYTDFIQNMLMLTGPPYRMQLGGFLSIQFVLALLFTIPLVLWAMNTSPTIPVRWLLAGIFGVTLGAYLPYFWLARRVNTRKHALLRALPGALDFLSINVEAGMGFDAAIAEVSRRWQNPLTQEFGMLLIDFQIGKPRKDAWRDLVNRTRLPELSAFVTAMLQNEQVGGSISHLLRTQAQYLRIQRRQRAEEAARVAPVKMLIPMVFFIFPGILVVLIGPAIAQMIEVFGG